VIEMMNKKEAIRQLESMKPMDSETYELDGKKHTFARYSREQVLLLLSTIYEEEMEIQVIQKGKDWDEHYKKQFIEDHKDE
jgi:hypothetical protein